MKKKKKINSIFIIMAVFFVVQLVLSFFYNNSLNIGRHPESQRFSMWFSDSGMQLVDNIQMSINMEIFPDVYMKEQGIRGAERYKYTYGSSKIYYFFYNLFHEESKFKFFGDDSAIVNFRLWRMLLILTLFFIIGAIYMRKKLKFIPSKMQIVVEMLYSFFDTLAKESMGPRGANFVNYKMTLFLFILVSNWVGLFPIPGLMEPTRNLNVPLGLAIMGLCVIHFNALLKKGVVTYIKGFMEPFAVMLPLNIIGEASKVVSLSFRLFGNIFGGGIVVIVVSHLTMSIMVPVGMNMFFVMFSGTIQAFVFMMLLLTFLSLELAD